jgi:hypothetical protein
VCFSTGGCVDRFAFFGSQPINPYSTGEPTMNIYQLQQIAYNNRTSRTITAAEAEAIRNRDKEEREASEKLSANTITVTAERI